MPTRFGKRKVLFSLLILVTILIFSFQNQKEKYSAQEPPKDSPPAENIAEPISTPDKVESVPEEIAEPPKAQEPEKTYRIERIVDGDTIKVNIDGKIESVRLIGIDTPEINVTPKQCFALEAKSEAEKMLSGKNVILKNDASQSDRDKYNRLLRYVYIGDQFYNRYMVAEGFAHEYTYANNLYQFQSEFKSAESEARANKKGLWAANACKVPTATSPAVESAQGESTQVGELIQGPSDGCLIKGNISSGGKIYHIPGGAYYEKTVIDTTSGERWFCTEADAVAAGWRKSSR